MPAQRILRVKRVNPNEPDCIINASQNGDQLLDLKLVATEGSQVFVGTLRHKHIDTLRQKSYKGADSEWESILKRTIWHQSIPAEHSAAFKDLELLANVTSDGSTLELTWNHKKRSTTHKLASLELQESEDEQVELIDWTAIAIEAAESAADEVQDLKEQIEAANAKMARVEEQLLGLTEAKLNYENELLQKFADLLNNKKMKIRDQQRMLAGAKVDASTADSVAQARSAFSVPDARKTTTRASKRKAEAAAEESEESSDESDAFEDADRRTPEAMDTDSDEKEPTPPPVKKSAIRATIGGKKKAPATTATAIRPKVAAQSNVRRSSSPATVREDSQQESFKTKAKPDPVPPVRTLPFSKRSPKPAAKVAPADSGSETEEDDEL